VDWTAQTVEIHRRENVRLVLIGAYYAQDTLETPLLSGFSCRVKELFEEFPKN
jgi:Uma2 family endonuclease